MQTSIIRTIEEICLSAWPCVREVPVDGWVARFADGYTFRANSVQTLDAGSGDVIEMIERCEGLYASVGQPCAFKITPLARPEGLDSLLESRGYRVHTPTSVQVLDSLDPSRITSHASLPSLVSIHSFLSAYVSISGSGREKMPLHESILERIGHPLLPLVIRQEGQPVACGLGVLDGEYIGLYDIYTVPTMRRQGLAARICAGLLSRASDQGARKAYLSVIRDNGPAIALYGKLGFRHLYSYHYRIRD